MVVTETVIQVVCVRRVQCKRLENKQPQLGDSGEETAELLGTKIGTSLFFANKTNLSSHSEEKSRRNWTFNEDESKAMEVYRNATGLNFIPQ